MNTSQILRQLPNLTAIRFFLALFVVIYHVADFCKNRGLPYYNELAIFFKGKEAVYMFFSLSGFLIIKQLYDEKLKTGTIDLKGFYIRRVLRIFPLYYLILAFGFLYYHRILPGFGFEIENNYDLFTGILLSVTFFPNIFATYMPGGVLEILWSIGIEEQFYLFIAPLLLFLPIKRITTFLMIFTIIYCCIFFSGHFKFLDDFSMLYFYFSFSGFCAIVLENEVVKKLINKLRYFLLLLFVLYFTTSLFKSNMPLILYNLFGMVLFGLSISAFSLQSINILQNRFLNYGGKISYGIYMFHPITMQFIGLIYLKLISDLQLPYAWSVFFVYGSTIGLTILVSHLSYRYYELYFLKKKGLLTKRKH